MQALIARMDRTYPQYAALKYPKACTIEQARDCLGADEVALLYAPGAEASYLIVLAKEDDPRTAGITIHTLPPADAIAELVAGLTRPVTLEDGDSVRELGRRAYQMLLAPAAETIRGKALVIVPGGVLGLLPFELLVEPAEGPRAGDGRFLVEGHRLRYAPSLTVLHMIRRWEETRPEPERPLWALGDPVYQPSDARLTSPTPPAQDTRYAVAKYRDGIPGSAVARLPSSGVEVERLRQLWEAPPEAILVGPAATEAAVKDASASGGAGEVPLRPLRHPRHPGPGRRHPAQPGPGPGRRPAGGGRVPAARRGDGTEAERRPSRARRLPDRAGQAVQC